MTVCIAALHASGSEKAIITASDRMITRGEIGYEPFQGKLGMIGKSVCVLIAGTYQVHSEAFLKTSRQLAADPENEVGVIAEIYGSHIRQFRKRSAEQTYLSQWGLTMDDFLKRQSEFSAEFASMMIRRIENHDLEPAQAIVTGCDQLGSHIYLIDSVGRVSSETEIGFAAIGNGAEHAHSLFTEAGYSSGWSYTHALLLCYAAKRKAEIAPGVGKTTDMNYIFKGGREFVIPEFYDEAARIYSDFESKRNALVASAFQEFTEFVDNFKRPEQVPQQSVSAEAEKKDSTVTDHESAPALDGQNTKEDARAPLAPQTANENLPLQKEAG